MPRQYRLGRGSANIISSFEEKKEIINYLFHNVNLSNYRFQMLKDITQLEFLKKNEHFVSPNFNGVNYLLIFMKLKNRNRTFMIDRRKLKYNKEHLDLKSFLILEVDFKAENSIFLGTIIDGKLLRLENNKYIFICNDCYQLFGKSLITQKLEKKYQTLDKIIASEMSPKPCYNFEFKINKLYNYDKLDQLIKTIIPKTKLPINGIVFYPIVSGNIIIYSEKINKNSLKSKNDTKNIEKPITNFKIDNNSKDESYHIVRDLCLYLKSRTKTSIEDFKSYEKKELILRKSDIPDVYFLYENEDKPQIGIAHIPNLKVSQELYKIFENKKTHKMLCYLDKHFKKWSPILDN